MANYMFEFEEEWKLGMIAVVEVGKLDMIAVVKERK